MPGARCKLHRGEVLPCRRQRGQGRSSVSTLLLAILLLLLFFASSAAADTSAGTKPAVPPVVGRPAHFNGAVGDFRSGDVTLHAQPTELPAEAPLTLTLRITASGPVQRPPRRPDLKAFPEFATAFYIEDTVGEDQAKPEQRTWEFVYRLKPRSADVKAVPAFPFVFFRPGLRPAARGYQTIYAEAVPLTVTPPPPVTPPAVEGGTAVPELPDSVYALAEGPVVLQNVAPWRPPGPVLLALLLLVPPVGSLAWYLVWRRLYPDAARRARQRRSRAARQALEALRHARRRADGDLPLRATRVVTEYLRRRVDLPAVEPTPEEASAHLRTAGVTSAAAERVAAFYRAHEAFRFAPPHIDPADQAVAAEQLILVLESEPCLQAS